jgi:hypothetical protein
MERVACKSCGGALAKVGETTYRCTHCGTTHELGRDDSHAVRALLERNNERWVTINRRMDEFYAAVNTAAGYEAKRAKFMSWLVGASLFGVAWFAIFAAATATMPEDSPDKVEFVAAFGIVPWLLLALIVSGALAWGHLSQRKAMQRKARAAIGDVVEAYRAMSDKPVKDLLESLHNQQRLLVEGAPEIASAVYIEAIAASETLAAQQQPRPAPG